MFNVFEKVKKYTLFRYETLTIDKFDAFLSGWSHICHFALKQQGYLKHQ